MEERVRARVIVSGRVQGVAFRFEARRAAGRIGVVGWVRNAPSPVPLTRDGEAMKTDGLTMVRWIYPLPDSPPELE